MKKHYSPIHLKEMRLQEKTLQGQSSDSTMEAQDNLVETEKRSVHKSVEELEQEVSAKQSEIRELWKLKVKEKRFWKEGLCEKDVGWCDEHKNFCDVDSKCKPWDPIPATSAEG